MDDQLYDTWDEIARRRESANLAFQPKLNAFEALTYESVVAILRDPAAFSNQQTTMYPLEPSLANMDPPFHTPLRRTLIAAFSKSAIEMLTPLIVHDAHELVDRLPPPGSIVDIKRHFAVPLALHTIMRLLGIPETERHRLRAGTEAIEALASGAPRSPELAIAVRSVDEYFTALATQRLSEAESGVLDRNPRDPVAALVWAHLDHGIIDRSQVARNITVLFHGGNGTSTTLITNAIVALENAPEQKARFLQRPEQLVQGFVEETLRFEGSTHGLFRTAVAETTVGDVTFNDGDRVFCRFGAASRDPNAFPAPDEFDIERDWSQLPQHLGFGIGAHFCIGAPLARVEIAIALTTLYRRLPGLQLTNEHENRELQGLIFRGWDRLNVRYTDRV